MLAILTTWTSLVSEMPCKFLELWKMFKRFNLKACAWYCLCSKCEFIFDTWNCLYLQGLRVRSTWPRHEASHVSRVPVWYACATNRQHSTRYMWVSMATKTRYNILLLPVPEENSTAEWESGQRLKCIKFYPFPQSGKNGTWADQNSLRVSKIPPSPLYWI